LVKAGAVTRCGSGSGIYHGWEFKITQNGTVHTHSFYIFSNRNRTESNEDVSTFVKTLVHFKIFALLYSRVGAGAAGAASKF
jgi:hypothetical protein